MTYIIELPTTFYKKINMSKTAISPKRSEDFSKWYLEVTKELAESAPVRGCMTIKPYGYAIWERIQRIFDDRIKELDVQNAYFPLLIPVDFFSKEAKHIDGFAKECAVVTHSRLKKDEVSGYLVPDSKLSEPYVIRPTSETIIGHTTANWIQTYRDLPLKLNQWCNVMRWEMRPRLFLRTSEFLWQEGHTMFETEEEAREDALLMQREYEKLVKNDLCIPAFVGEKTEEERFPGAKNTYTFEIITQDGKALQGGTSHYLGTSFSKAFDIKFVGRDNKQYFAHTASWGITTRLIGAIVMTHGDDDGLVLPPNISPYEVVVLPIIHDESKKQMIMDSCKDTVSKLKENGIRVHLDSTDQSIPSKAWKWIKRGAPLRIEIGAREIDQGSYTLFRRDLAHKERIQINDLSKIKEILLDFSKNIYKKALDNRMVKDVKTMEQIKDLYKSNYQGCVLIDFKETECDRSFFDEFSLSRRCIIQDKVLIGRSY